MDNNRQISKALSTADMCLLFQPVMRRLCVSVVGIRIGGEVTHIR
jgi:hypothetical protein